MTGHAALLDDLQAMQKQSDGSLTLLLVDAGYPGKIIAQHGQQAADDLLYQVATLLKNFCRKKDSVSRIGDHTFAVLLAGVSKSGHTVLAAEKIMRMQREVLETSDSPVRLDLSIGIASFPRHTKSPEDLVQKARIALEVARDTKSGYATYSPVVAATMASKWDLQQELVAAIETGSLELYFQPKVSAVDRQPVGAEALMRWTSLKHGPIGPDIFIPLAEQAGLMKDLTRYAINAALRQASEWPDIGRPLAVAVNMTPESIQDPDLVDIVNSALSIWGAPNRELVLEITESALVEDSENSFATLYRLRELGVGISIDDFGTGYSSLSYFKDIPASELKIDQSFVLNMLTEEKDRNIVETVIWLAHRFDLTVVAEGVESVEILEALAGMGCDVAQGYYFAKALPQEEFIEWLIDQSSKTARA
ncbi:MAG: bifunctional diguanylate cyclase/phosphodiesterase [Gammaproteobacteria bacterium]|nr:bifunctional diguanylate cyclase/phosphodiesterase [Gammaproteobacteria bacterium]